MTTFPDGRAGKLPGRMRNWLSARRKRREAFDALAALDHLNDHLLRDMGLFRERSAGPRRYDPWV